MNKIGSFPAWRKFDKVVNLHLWRRVKGAGGGGGEVGGWLTAKGTWGGAQEGASCGRKLFSLVNHQRLDWK